MGALGAIGNGHGPHYRKPRWAVRFGRKGWWWLMWTPQWHEGRGPYISIGIGLVAIYRGY